MSIRLNSTSDAEGEFPIAVIVASMGLPLVDTGHVWHDGDIGVVLPGDVSETPIAASAIRAKVSGDLVSWAFVLAPDQRDTVGRAYAYVHGAGLSATSSYQDVTTSPGGGIVVGATTAAGREFPFELVALDGTTDFSAHSFTAGEVRVVVLDGSSVNVTTIVHKGGNGFAGVLTADQVTAAGKAYPFVEVVGAEPWQSFVDIVPPASSSGSTGPYTVHITGVSPDPEVYASVAMTDAFLGARSGPGPTAWRALVTANDTDGRARLAVSATSAIDSMAWAGAANGAGGTTLEWPRDGVTITVNGVDVTVDPTMVPAPIVQAEMLLAGLGADDDEVFDPSTDTSVASVGAGGGVEVSFFRGAASSGVFLALPPAVMRLIAPYLASTAGSGDGSGGMSGVGRCESEFASWRERTRTEPY